VVDTQPSLVAESWLVTLYMGMLLAMTGQAHFVRTPNLARRCQHSDGLP
jgi:hypothetical protein